MQSSFNSNFGGIGQEPNPHAIRTPKGDFNRTFGGVGQDISRHAIPPAGRIGVDLSNQTPSRDISNAPVPTAQTGTQNAIASNASKYPFDITPVNSTTISFVAGTISSLVPSNMTNTFTVSPSSLQYACLDCTASDGVLQSCVISIQNSPPAFIGVRNGYPPNTFSIVLHLLDHGVYYRTIGNASLQALPFEAFRVQKTTTTPDKLPYDSYYTWELSDV